MPGGSSESSGVEDTASESGDDGSTSGGQSTTGDEGEDTADAATQGEESGSGETTGGLVCDPRAGEMCLACLGQTCCAELTTCAMDPGCACVAQCIGSGSAADGCLAECGVVEPTPALTSLQQCAQRNCSEGDECPES
jgi:hypothetical protein